MTLNYQDERLITFADNLAAKTHNRYEIIGRLGQGAMGDVYQGRDTDLQRNVAIKVPHLHLLEQDPQLRDRFVQEARAAARLRHPGIVTVHDISVAPDLLYILMEYVPGQNLQQALHDLTQKGQRLRLSDAVRLLQQICLALHYAHLSGILHRDLKPANIILRPTTDEIESYQPVIADLGLAKLLEGGMVTGDNVTMGTPAYMSPEQAEGRPVDARSDIYALGVLFYQLATGQLPFSGGNWREAIRFHREEKPQPRKHYANLPVAVEEIIVRAMAKNPAARYQSALQMAEALTAILPQLATIHISHEEQEKTVVVNITDPKTQGTHHLIIRTDSKSFQSWTKMQKKTKQYWHSIKQKKYQSAAWLLTILLLLGSSSLWFQRTSYAYPGPAIAAFLLALAVGLVGLSLEEIKASAPPVDLPKVFGIERIVSHWMQFKSGWTTEDSKQVYDQIYRLQKVFANRNSREITILEALPGNKPEKGAFLVHPDNGTKLVLKFDRLENIKDEFQYYQNCIEGRLGNTPGKPISSWPSEADWPQYRNNDKGVIVYNLAKIGDGELKTFAAYYKTASLQNTQDVLRKIVIDLDKDLWDTKYPQSCAISQPKVFDEYRRLYDQNKLSRMESGLIDIKNEFAAFKIIKDERFFSVDGNVKHFDNPFFWIKQAFASEHIFTHKYGRLLEDEPKSIVHGDFHAGNILVEVIEEKPFFWLIDFPKTHVGSTVHDIARLEADIKFNLFPAHLIKDNLQELVAFEEKILGNGGRNELLLASRRLEAPTLSGELGQELNKVWQSLSILRYKKKDLYIRGQAYPYYLALLHATMPMLYYDDLTPSQKLYALISASFLCKRLATWNPN